MRAPRKYFTFLGTPNLLIDDNSEKITVKSILQHKENLPALGDNLDVLNVLSDSTKQVDDIHDTDTLDDLVEHVDD